MGTVFIAARALVFAVAFMGSWFWVVLRVQPLSREWDVLLPIWIAAPGFGLGLAGTLGIIVCVTLFVVRGHGTPAIFDAPQRFVAVGPYKYVRNPMYLSGVATFLGFGLSVRSLAVLAFAGAWFLLIHTFVVFIEEPGLRRRFGGTYDAYLHRVPRWMPRVAVAIFLVLFLVTPTHGQPARQGDGPFPAPERRTDVELREPGR